MSGETGFSALVTGGASGIGAAVSRKLASRGINVLIADVQDELGEKLAQEIKSAFKVEAVYLHTDVSKEADIRNMIATVVKKFGRLDYAANVAGICENTQFEEHSITAETVDSPEVKSILIRDCRTYSINQRGVWLCQKLEAEQMITQERRAVEFSPPSPQSIQPQRGAIVNVASTTAVVGMGFGAYAQTKAAVVTITQNGAFFYGPQGVRCNSISPGGTVTPMMLRNVPEQFRGTDTHEQPGNVLVQPIALKTMARPEEQANVISFLLSAESSQVTGVNILVDGGFTFTRSG
ncbi:short-chain dehydrogenase/reductase SDR [Fonsecaea pedrosoi]|nr:short-chain dehydrogenase/reductase SDR [Fonsecaea pedrosoi]